MAFDTPMDRYNLALLVFTVVVLPLFLVSGWLSLIAAIAIYCLLARLADRDLDRRRTGRLRPLVIRRPERGGHAGQVVPLLG